VAIYHLSVKPVSRAGGRSATAAAAYRSGSEIADRTTGQVFDYTRKRGIDHSEIVLPTEAAKRDINWARDRQSLWNAAEEAEKRKDARVAREYEVALPHELSRQQRLELVRAFSQEVANRYGNAVDFSIHAPHREGDERNHHAHILTTTRKVEATGLGAKTEIELADGDRAKRGLGPAKAEVTEIRARWAALTNEYLASHGHASRVDHRSLEAQGIDREPTVHKGPAVSGMERRGMPTEVGFRIAQEAEARLARAAELGRLEREGREIRSEIISLSTDVAAALRARAGEGTMPKPPTKEPPVPVAAIAAQGREQWLAEREAQKIVKADDVAIEAALKVRREPAVSRDADQERLAAIERWKSMVNGATEGDGRGVSHDDGDSPGPERGRGRSGPGSDHGL
jgi:ATP-dependent exoDNAse (exonuclease V) alpha subunit